MRFTRTTMIALAGLLASAPVMADEAWTWDLTGAVSSGTCVSDCGLPQTIDVSAGAWANTEPGTSTSQLGPAILRLYPGGFGVTHGDGETTTVPQHAVDNDNRYELVLFDFGAASVALSEVALGWFENDADISLLAYEGTTVPTLSGETYNATTESLTSVGWTLVGNYGTGAIGENNYGSKTYAVNASGIASSYWIVAAYNDAFGGTCFTGTNCDEGVQSSTSWVRTWWGWKEKTVTTDYRDYFKVASLNGTVKPREPGPSPVPVPNPLALSLVGLTMLMLRRRLSA